MRVSSAPTKRRRPTAGGLRPGDSFLHADRRVTVVEISTVGYGHRRGAPYRRLRIRGTTSGGEQVTAYYASDEPVCR